MNHLENNTFCYKSTVNKKIFEKSITDEGIKHTLGVLPGTCVAEILSTGNPWI